MFFDGKEYPGFYFEIPVEGLKCRVFYCAGEHFVPFKVP